MEGSGNGQDKPIRVALVSPWGVKAFSRFLNLCINLTDPERVRPFYNPPARGRRKIFPPRAKIPSINNAAEDKIVSCGSIQQ
jgi:hypothetical protein